MSENATDLVVVSVWQADGAQACVFPVVGTDTEGRFVMQYAPGDFRPVWEDGHLNHRVAVMGREAAETLLAMTGWEAEYPMGSGTKYMLWDRFRVVWGHREKAA